MPADDRPVWFLVPGGIPFRGGAAGRSVPAGAAYYCYQGDRAWRPIAGLFPPGAAGVSADPPRGRPLCRTRGGGRGPDERFFAPLEID